MTTNPAPKTRHPKLILALLLAVLLGPLLFAMVLIQKGNVHQLRLNNNGDLITPAIELTNIQVKSKKGQISYPFQDLQEQWHFVLVMPADCSKACDDMAYQLKQIKTALGKNSNRLAFSAVINPKCAKPLCLKEFQAHADKLTVIQLPALAWDNLFNTIGDSIKRDQVGELYLVDPRGFLIMHYDIDTPPKAILSDLKRLLKVSKIG